MALTVEAPVHEPPSHEAGDESPQKRSKQDEAPEADSGRPPVTQILPTIQFPPAPALLTHEVYELEPVSKADGEKSAPKVDEAQTEPLSKADGGESASKAEEAQAAQQQPTVEGGEKPEETTGDKPQEDEAEGSSHKAQEDGAEGSLMRTHGEYEMKTPEQGAAAAAALDTGEEAAGKEKPQAAKEGGGGGSANAAKAVGRAPSATVTQEQEQETGPRVRYFLMKTDPNEYSIDDLAQEPQQTTVWDGVRNHTTKKVFQDEMWLGDQVFLYHSSKGSTAGEHSEHQIAGIVEVCREAFPDPTAVEKDSSLYDAKHAEGGENPWLAIEVKLVKKLQRPITLDQLKAHSKGKDDPLHHLPLLTRQQRSRQVVQISPQEWDFITSLNKSP